MTMQRAEKFRSYVLQTTQKAAGCPVPPISQKIPKNTKIQKIKFIDMYIYRVVFKGAEFKGFCAQLLISCVLATFLSKVNSSGLNFWKYTSLTSR